MKKPDEKWVSGKEKCKSFHKYRKTLADFVVRAGLRLILTIV
ncbi:hypothetical protein [Larkinella sp. C7]|nr:hypothetical protein [Larkinella sp. C7]